MRTENQIRAWLQIKIENYLWKIKQKNSYGSRKKLETISKDLRKILNRFDRYRKSLPKKRKG